MTVPNERGWRLPLLLLALLMVFCAPMLASPDGFLSGDAYRDNDWLTDRFFDLAARKSLLEEGAFPLRSHLIGGGYPTLGQPFDGSWAPTIIAVLLLGPVLGVKLNLFLLLGLGTWGMWRLGADWLRLPREAAGFGAAAFAVSGWFPSMMLVGFYPQALYMALPGALALSLAPRRSEDRIVAGFLLFLLLQQGGFAFAASLGFLVVALWADLAYTTAKKAQAGSGNTVFWRHHTGPWLSLFAVTAGLALHYRYASLPWLLLSGGGVALLASRFLREFAKGLKGSLLVLGAVLLVVGTLGIGKVTALVPILKAAEYAHADNLPPSAWPGPKPGVGAGASVDPNRHDEHFYSSFSDLLVGMLGRAPKQGMYVAPHTPPQGRELLEPVDRRSATREYEYLGLTPPLFLLLLLGMFEAVRSRESRPLVLTAGAVAVCMGPHLLPDLHFLLAGGLPLFRSLSQPVKYYNFFILLSSCLLLGLAARLVLSFAERRGGVWLGRSVLALALVWPVVQNAPVWADRFAKPMPSWSCDDCRQIKQIGHPSWVGELPETIELWSDRHRLRERRRPPAAREYDNALHGVGTIDWYGTLELPEPTYPSHYVTSQGAVLRAPGYRGEAWISEEGRPEKVKARIASHEIELSVELARPARVVINQAFLAGFVSDVGIVQSDESGLLALDLPEGAHRALVRYRPWPQILGLLVSGMAGLFWLTMFLGPRRKRMNP